MEPQTTFSCKLLFSETWIDTHKRKYLYTNVNINLKKLLVYLLALLRLILLNQFHFILSSLSVKVGGGNYKYEIVVYAVNNGGLCCSIMVCSICYSFNSSWDIITEM